jgi:Flp pilus assembly protein TadD
MLKKNTEGVAMTSRIQPLALAVLLALTVVGCQQIPEQTKIDPARIDLLLPQPSVDELASIESATQIFALPDEAIQSLRGKLAIYDSTQERSYAILKFIFKENNDAMKYINGETLTASEALKRGQANCLSLTILAYSLANSVGFKTEFRDVKIPEYWITRNGESFLNGHVNLQVQAIYPEEKPNIVYAAGSTYVIDFERGVGLGRLPYQAISQKDIIALFYNNKAAETMEKGDYQRAMLYLKAAGRTQPTLPDTWNNLAVWYKRQGQITLAEQAYLQSLQLDPNHSNTMANLAILYSELGRADEAAQLERKVERNREQNPYYFLMLGNEAVSQQQFDEAQKYYQRSLLLNDQIAETHFSLAKLLLQQGRYDAAATHLNKARQLTGPGPERDVLQHKLDLLHAVAHVN